jgi:hypothetical protein
MNIKSIFELFSFSKESKGSPLIIIVVAFITFFIGMLVGRKSNQVEPCYSESRMPVATATAQILEPDVVKIYRTKHDTLRIMEIGTDTLQIGISEEEYNRRLSECEDMKNLVAYDSYLSDKYELEQMYSFSDRTFTHSLRWYGDSLMVTNAQSTVWGSVWDVTKYAFTALVGVLVGMGLTTLF